MVSDRKAALADLEAHVDLARASGDELRAVQDRHGLTVVEVADLVLELQRTRKIKVKRGSLAQRLIDSDSAGSIPFAELTPFEPDLGAPRLDNIGTVKIGVHRIARLGVGCMRLVSQGGYVGRKAVSAIGLPRSPEANRHALLNAVQVSGVGMLDLARGYGPWPGAGEGILRDWFAPFPRGLVIASKVGYRRKPDSSWMVDLDPDFLRQEVTESFRQLGAPVPLMYLVVRSTPLTPVVNRPRQLRRALQPLLDAQKAGEIDQIGIANVTAAEAQQLCDAGPVAVVQNRFTLHALKDKAQRAVFDFTQQKGLPFVTWGLFGEGVQPRPPAPDAVIATAEAMGVSAEEVTLAALLAASPHVVPLPGPGRRSTLESCLLGATLQLPPAVKKALLRSLL